ncbi:MAG: type II toxin-antitoxin system RelE/ParE family toxin [Chitinophagaceae bacterium]|nr:type II toxin-antitoxin system RelE/ParE family toxin [Chitinophagaceae bacterium]
MSYNVILIENFKKESKRLIKKFPSLKQELKTLNDKLEDNPAIGTPLAKSCYKIRLAVASKGKGKSGGARIITHVYVEGKKVFLLSIYDKSEREDIDNQEIERLLKGL